MNGKRQKLSKRQCRNLQGEPKADHTNTPRIVINVMEVEYTDLPGIEKCLKLVLRNYSENSFELPSAKHCVKLQ